MDCTMKKPLSYLDLVIETVRGHSPVREYQHLDRSALAQEYLDSLREKHANEPSGNDMVDTILASGPEFLLASWEKLAPTALSMCGEKTITHLREAMTTIQREQIPGDFLEAGVWRGGLPIIMRAFLEATDDRERKVYLADSFQGLPEDVADPNDQAANLLLQPLGSLAVDRQQVEAAFDFFGLNDKQVEILEGWFSDTLGSRPDETLALIRLDGDYYESTRDAITALYGKLSVGGYVIIDDYNLPLGCKRAVD